MIFNKKVLSLIVVFFAASLGVKSQVSITNISIQGFNITPESLLNVGIINNGNEVQVQLLTQVFNSSSSVLMTVKSKPFVLKNGLNIGNSSERKVLSINYASSNQASYIKTAHNLPSGRYKICASVLPIGGADKMDDLCEELEAEFNQYLYLINPNDGDTIETKNPLLSWTHSEPFTILNQGESYRMVVTEIKKNQSADDAITVNSPVMSKNYLVDHQLQYPIDAKELKEGAIYAWQVQKLSDGVVINKTEAWTFVTRNVSNAQSVKYIAVKPELDGSYYSANNGKVYFKFSEEYKTEGRMRFQLLDAKSNPIDIQIERDFPNEIDLKSTDQMKLKVLGDNQYELDLNQKHIKSGFYTLVIKNEKSEAFYLKIFLP